MKDFTAILTLTILLAAAGVLCFNLYGLLKMAFSKPKPKSSVNIHKYVEGQENKTFCPLSTEPENPNCAHCRCGIEIVSAEGETMGYACGLVYKF